MGGDIVKSVNKSRHTESELHAMNLNRHLKKVAAAAALAVSILPASQATGNVAHAAPVMNGLSFGGSTYAKSQPTHGPVQAVIFGDSVPANSNPLGVASGKLGPGPAKDAARDIGGATPYNRIGCSSDGHFADAYSRGSGLSVGNYACSGSSYVTGGFHTIDNAIDIAASKGDLNHGTQEVAIMAGANDTYPRLSPGGPTPADLAPIIKNGMVNSINHVRKYAPNARIKIIGYPQVTDRFGAACTIDVVPGFPSGHIPGVGGFEAAVQWAGATAAREAGATFVDLKPASQGHGTCDNDRWYSGVIDTTAPSKYKLLLHLNDNGVEQTGRIAGER